MPTDIPMADTGISGAAREAKNMPTMTMIRRTVMGSMRSTSLIDSVSIS